MEIFPWKYISMEIGTLGLFPCINGEVDRMLGSKVKIGPFINRHSGKVHG
jgi:hypothetical protein